MRSAKNGVRSCTPNFSYEFTPDAMLKYAIDNGIIDMKTIQEEICMTNRKKYLSMHNHKIWVGKDGGYYTYLRDENGRKLFRKSSRTQLDDVIADFYKQQEENPSIQMFFKKWNDERLSNNEIGPNSHYRYDTDFKRFFRPDDRICKKGIKDITEADIMEHIKLNIIRYNLSRKAYSGLRTLVLGIFKQAKLYRLTDISISTFFSDIQLSKNLFRKQTKKDEDNVFNDDEVKKLSKYLLDHPSMQNLGLILMLESGVRVGELAALKWSSISEAGILIETTEIYYKDKDTGEHVITIKDSPKLGAESRMVTIPDSARRILWQLKKMNPFGEYIFMKNGKRIGTASFNQHLYRACDAVNIPRRSSHKLRKTYASKLIDANVEESIIKAQMGHSDINTTRTYYYFQTQTDEYKKEQIEKAISI